jgi:hypothetical protein
LVTKRQTNYKKPRSHDNFNNAFLEDVAPEYEYKTIKVQGLFINGEISLDNIHLMQDNDGNDEKDEYGSTTQNDRTFAKGNYLKQTTQELMEMDFKVIFTSKERFKI